MFRYLLTFFFASILSCHLSGQSISGTVLDAVTNMPVSNATVTLQIADSSEALMVSVSDASGHFNFDEVSNGAYNVSVTSVGYASQNKPVTVTDQNVKLKINIARTEQTLSTVFINGAPPPVKQNGDTLDYSANQFKVNPDATSEDLIKKMPGVTVDKTGTVTAQGETVKKVTVDGRDFFGDDATATLRNLPAEVVDKIQVFDKLSDQAQLTGFDDGNTQKSINIVTKKDMRNGNFGRIYGGYGTDDRYSGGGNVSFFNNARRISLLALVNNVNQQNFSSQDLIGATSGGGGPGGGGRRGGTGGGNFRGGGPDFMVGPQTGIAKTNAFGINYSDAWGRKIDVTGSYFFNNSSTTNNQIINQQNFITKDSSQYYGENTLSDTKNYNNRVNFRLTYRMDSSNTCIATSNLNFQKNNSVNSVNGLNYLDESEPNILSKTVNDLNSTIHANNLNNMLLFRHAFAKQGRSISLGIFQSSNNRNGQRYLDAFNSYYKPTLTEDTVKQLSDQKSLTNQYRLSLEYTEPIAPKTQMQISYGPSFQSGKANQATSSFDDGTSKYSILDTSLSNNLHNTYNMQNAGVTFRHGDRNNMVAAGVSYQYSELKSKQVFPGIGQIDNTYSNFLANVFSRFKLSPKSTLRIIYRGSVSPPSVTQLQNVINNTNQFFYTTGNPDLQQQYTNNLITRFTYTNSAKGQSFFANIFLQKIDNYITNATYTAAHDSTLSPTVILYRGSQLSKPVNRNGYVNARSFFTFGLPLKFAKMNLNMNAGLSYGRQPGLLNNVENISNAYNYNLGAALSSNISEYIDFNLSYSANINTVKNSIQPTLNNNYFIQSAGINANFLTKKGLLFQNDLSNETYKGLAGGFNQNYWLWNMAVGQKFLKNRDGELKLSVFDLLKQNKSISRNVTESYVQDQINQVLQQYFMVTFTYKLKTFGKGKPVNNGERQMDFRRFEGFGGPPHSPH